jgi:hypothetical protein
LAVPPQRLRKRVGKIQDAERKVQEARKVQETEETGRTAESGRRIY